MSGPNTNGRTGLGLEPHDLCLAKLAAYREKDLVFVAALLDAGLINAETLAVRIPHLPVTSQVRRRIEEWLAPRRRPERS